MRVKIKLSTKVLLFNFLEKVFSRKKYLKASFSNLQSQKVYKLIIKNLLSTIKPTK